MNLNARYTSHSVQKLSSVSLSYAGGDKYSFDWIIPQGTDTESFNEGQYSYKIFDGAGHGLNMEKPEMVNKEIVTYLNGQ